MRRRRIKQFLSYALIFGGAFLLFRGAREFLESRWGQYSAAHELDDLGSAPPVQTELRATGFRPQTGEAVGKLVIPRLDAQLYVVEGTDAKDLRRGPGHLKGTALPGENGNCVIAGHRDTHFRVLKDIHRGDDIVLQTRDGQFLYRVKTTEIVSPKNTASIQPTAGPVLNLITCYPFYYLGAAPKRFVVEAELVGSLNAATTPAPTVSRNPS